MNIHRIKAQVENIRALIAESRVSEAIQSFIELAKAANKPELRDELIAMSAQQRRLETEARKYIADATEIQMRQNRLLEQMLGLLSNVENGEWVEEEAESRPAPIRTEREKRRKASPLPWIIGIGLLVVVVGFLILKFTGRKGGGAAENPCLELKQEARKRAREQDYAGARELLTEALKVCDDKQEVEDLIAIFEQRRREEQPAEEERPPRHETPEEPKREAEPEKPQRDTPPPAGFQVSRTLLKASPAEYSGDCPQRITFDGAISVQGGGGVVSYRFIRSDGAQGPVETLRFDGPGQKKVSTNWTLGGAGRVYERYWQAIQILEPNPMESEKAYFNLRCEAAEPEPQREPEVLGPRVTKVRLQAGPADYTGTCPQEIVFLGYISSDGPGVVSYQFVRSDGAKGQVQQVRFNGPGTERVRTTWRLGASGKEYLQYWQVLQVLEPNPMESNKAYFNLRCR